MARVSYVGRRGRRFTVGSEAANFRLKVNFIATRSRFESDRDQGSAGPIPTRRRASLSGGAQRGLHEPFRALVGRRLATARYIRRRALAPTPLN